MKKTTYWMALTGLCLPLADLAAQEAGEKPDRKEGKKPPMEKVAYLGVAVSPVSPSLRAQLGIAEGTGLLVQHVESESAAAGKIESHDVLTRFDDQVLVNPEQLTVLVRNTGASNDVDLTVLRKGNEEVVKVTLGEREMPVRRHGDGFGMPFQFRFNPQGDWRPDQNWHKKQEEIVREMKERAEEVRKKAEEHARGARHKMGEFRGREPRRPGAGPEEPGKPPVHNSVRHSTWVEDGLILNLVQNGENKRLTVQKDGETIFEGPVDTEDQRERIPEEYREKLKKMEGDVAPKKKPASDNIL